MEGEQEVGLWKRGDGEGAMYYLWEKVFGQYDNKDTQKQDPCLRGGERVGGGMERCSPHCLYALHLLRPWHSASMVSLQKWGKNPVLGLTAG